jgi:hypothetical protein
MTVMELTAAPSPFTVLAQRLRRIAILLRETVAARGPRDKSMVPMIWLIAIRLGRLATRFEQVIARLVAGKVSAPRRAYVRKASFAVVRPEGELRLPTRKAWLIRTVQETAVYSGHIEHLLTDPDMIALLATSPAACKIMRQFCHMLGMDLGPALALPADRKPAPRKSRVGQYRPRKRVQKPVNTGPAPSAMAVIFAALNPGVAIWPEIKPKKWKPPWFSIGR